MKGLDHDIAPVEQHEAKEVREKDRYIASMKLNPGQSVFKYLDKKISIIGENDYVKTSIAFRNGEEMKAQKRLIMEKGALYVVALNKKNAIKKFIRLLK